VKRQCPSWGKDDESIGKTKWLFYARDPRRKYGESRDRKQAEASEDHMGELNAFRRHLFLVIDRSAR